MWERTGSTRLISLGEQRDDKKLRNRCCSTFNPEFAEETMRHKDDTSASSSSQKVFPSFKGSTPFAVSFYRDPSFLDPPCLFHAEVLVVSGCDIRLQSDIFFRIARSAPPREPSADWRRGLKKLDRYGAAPSEILFKRYTRRG